MIKRAGLFLFAVLTVALACAAAVDVYLHSQFTVIDPSLLAAVALAGTAFLLLGFVSERDRADALEGRAGRLAQLAGELEAFITLLEAANARLSASEARYKDLVDAQGDAILRRTPDGRMTYANEGFFRLFGGCPDDTFGWPFCPKTHPDFSPSATTRLADGEGGRERASYDQHLRTQLGYRWIAWEDYAIRDGDGRVIEIQSVGHDVTERKMLEAALTVARDKAQDANRAKSLFLATMSHEIRTPMNGVLGMARLLAETPLAPDQKTYAEAIRQSGLVLLALIEDILDFSKIESGALVLDRGEVALRPLIEGIAELLSTRAHAKDIEIATAIDADVPATIRADGIRLRQVLTNLVGNAVKFTEEGGVLVSACVEHHSVDAPVLLLSVRDTGIGVPANKQTQIFEDFVQADSSHARRFEGTGLGLAISRRLVEAMGGKIGVVSEENRGSLFWVRLPLEQIAPPAPSHLLKAKRVALISDSAMLRAGLVRQLEAAGADYVDVRNLDLVLGKHCPCDLVLVDAGKAKNAALPDVRGFDLPVVSLLSHSKRTHLPALSEKGIRGYLMKPVRQDSLEKRLAALCEGKTEPIARPSTSAPEPRRGQGLSILLAEDNPVNALLARELLRRRGHRVEAVTTGQAAVAACAARRFDVVIMDLHMPGLDGIEATLRIRRAESEDSAVKPVPIFALTADTLEAGRKACIEAGMDGFLTKPVDPADLDAVLETIAAPPARLVAQ